MADNANLAAQSYEIAKFGTARNTRLRHDNAMPSDDDVVPDLDEIINFRAFSDNRISKGTAVDRRVGSDLHIVLHHDPADLWDFHVSFAAHGEAKAILADGHARVQDDSVSDQSMGDGCVGSDITVPANVNPVPDDRAGGDSRPPADLSLWADDGAGLDNDVLLEDRRWMDGVRRSPAPCRTGCPRSAGLRVEQRNGLGKAPIGLGHDERGRSPRYLAHEFGRDDACARPRACQGR